MISFLSKTSVLPTGVGSHWRNVQDCESSWKDFSSSLTCAVSSPVFSSPHTASLYSLSLSFFFSSEFVNSVNDWFWERRALRVGKRLVISKLFALWILHALLSWQLMWICRHCSVGQYVCCHSVYNKGTVICVWGNMYSTILLTTQRNTTWILDTPTNKTLIVDSILTNTINSTLSRQFIRYI